MTARWRGGTLWRLLVVWLLVSTMSVAVGWKSIVAMRFGDPDDALRLQQVRDLLAGQGWFDLHQYRIAAPEGVPMHWSRLVDIPLAAVQLLLRPLLGVAGAESATLVIVPLLTLLCGLLLVGRLAARRADAEAAGVACLVLGMAAPVLFQMSPLRIDHHGWQIVLALAAMNGLFAHDPRRGGFIVGLSLAALLSISIEGLPLTALFLAICALRGLRRPDARFDWLASATATLALASGTFFLATRGLSDLAQHCDAISPVHLAALGLCAGGVMLLRALGPRAVVVQIGLLSGTGAGALAIMLAVAPECRGGAFVALDPLVRTYWYAGVVEGLPFWRSPPSFAATAIVVPLVGVLACLDNWRRETDAVRRADWLDHALLVAGAWLIGLGVARATATACALAAVPTGVLLLRRIVSLRETAVPRRLAAYLLIALALMPSMPIDLWDHFVRRFPQGERPGVAGVSAAAGSGALRESRCRYAVAAAALDRLPATDIFAPLDIGPDLLVRTHHRVIATGHHRAQAAMHDVIAAFMASPETARAIVARRHAGLLAICPDIAEPAIYAQAAPDGLMARLLDGRAPAWLEPVDLAPGSNLRFWRVRGAALSAFAPGANR